jgi:hypothetical protein
MLSETDLRDTSPKLEPEISTCEKKRMETSGHIDAFEQVSEYKNERQSQMQVCNIGQCESKNVKKDYFL